MRSIIKSFTFLFIFLLAANTSFAQEGEVEITDEELRRYAITMDSIERMKGNIVAVMTTMVQENEEITGTRYNELNKIIDDSVALVQAGATEDEIAFVRSVVLKKDEMTEEINATFKTLAIDFIGEGGRTYKKIKSALASDEEVKERYEEIMEDLKEAAEESNEELKEAVEEAAEDVGGNG
ncbi:MAG: hypothetical protein ACNS60_07770 [Candidatus Cyclobacteriaceae bacterium M2_1C_046]